MIDPRALAADRVGVETDGGAIDVVAL